MTTVAWDGKTLATDSQQTTTFIMTAGVEKLMRIPDGPAFASCGKYSDRVSLARWLSGASPEKPKIEEGFLAVVIDGGEAILYDNNLVPMEIRPPFACGSGQEFAMGAMLAGADARQAVKIAIELDPNSGGDVQAIDF